MGLHDHPNSFRHDNDYTGESHLLIALRKVDRS